MFDQDTEIQDDLCDGHVRTREDVVPGSRQLKGVYVSEDTGEAVFVPPHDFLAQPPLWRADVLQDLIFDMERLRRAALLEWEKNLANRVPDISSLERVLGFSKVCRAMGIDLPPEVQVRLSKRAALKGPEPGKR